MVKDKVQDLVSGLNDKSIVTGKSEDDILDIVEGVDIKKKIIDIHKTEIKTDLSSDIVLARFEKDKDKVFIIDLYNTAAVVKSVMTSAIDKLDNYYKKNPLAERMLQNKTWEKRKLDCIKVTKDTVEMIMAKIHVLSALNRNVRDNYLIKDLLDSTRQEEIQEEDDGKFSKEIKAIKNKLKNEEKEQP